MQYSSERERRWKLFHSGEATENARSLVRVQTIVIAMAVKIEYPVLLESVE